jgi:hypothetical protein
MMAGNGPDSAAPMNRSALLLVAIAWLTACGGGAKREASTLSAAVERFRRADNASKPVQAQTVAGVACSDSRVCGAKRACLAAIDPTARALSLKDEVARLLVDIQDKRLSPDSPEARALPGKLDEAETLLHEGRAKMSECERKMADLAIELGV